MSDDPLPALTPDQMSQVDSLMASEFAVGTLQSMEVAGQTVAAWARERLLGGDARAKQVVVLAGSGDNGGDGMVAARLLHAWGARPAVWLSHGVDRLAPAAAHQARSLAALGVPLHAPPLADEAIILPPPISSSTRCSGSGSAGRHPGWPRASSPAPTPTPRRRWPSTSPPGSTLPPERRTTLEFALPPPSPWPCPKPASSPPPLAPSPARWPWPTSASRRRRMPGSD